MICEAEIFERPCRFLITDAGIRWFGGKVQSTDVEEIYWYAVKCGWVGAYTWHNNQGVHAVSWLNSKGVLKYELRAGEPYRPFAVYKDGNVRYS